MQGRMAAQAARAALRGGRACVCVCVSRTRWGRRRGLAQELLQVLQVLQVLCTPPCTPSVRSLADRAG